MNAWRVFITPAAERIVKKLPREVADVVFRQFPELAKDNPFIGAKLSGPLAWIRSFHFSANGKPYRIAYSINQKTAEIFILYVGHRSSFYERLRQRLDL